MPIDVGSAVHILLFCAFGPVSVGIMLAFVWWLINDQGQGNEAQRVDEIMTHHAEWGDATCRTLIAGQVSVGMSQEMVTLSWGAPEEESRLDDGQIEWRYPPAEDRAQPSFVRFAEGKVVDYAGVGVAVKKEQVTSSMVLLYIGILVVMAFTIIGIAIVLYL